MLIVCPINPFEWPVKASVAKAALHSLAGAYQKSTTARSISTTLVRRQIAATTLSDARSRKRARVPQETTSLWSGGDGALDRELQRLRSS